MMRPGLDKPGALPLLALIVFSLLTLVPSLSSIYNIKFVDFSYFTGGARSTSIGFGLIEKYSVYANRWCLQSFP
jgi:hypothetical protein